MLLVETELTYSVAFRSASGKCSRMCTLGKVRQAGCGTCGCAVCTHPDTPLPETGTTRLPAFIQGIWGPFQNRKDKSK